MINVMFVCLGNICRSPMAEAIFREIVQEAGLANKISVSSSGTSSYHVGEHAHPDTLRVLQSHGIQFDHLSQQIDQPDMLQADYLVAMDRSNLRNLKRMDRNNIYAEKISLLLEYAHETELLDVPDPYYEGNFERVFQLVKAGCQGLLKDIQNRHIKS